MSIAWNDLFPTKISYAIFVGYMALFVGQGILVTNSQDSKNSYKYDTVAVVLLTEFLKLLVSILMYFRNNSMKYFCESVKREYNILFLYFIPALLYCFYNNLAFINLSKFDPTTYYLLLQFRVVIVGVLFQVIFKKYLTKRQWLSLLILTAGCVVKQIHINEPEAFKKPSKNMDGFDLSLNAVLILVQTICSCLAGVYTEYLLKTKAANLNIFMQNIFMYVDSIICNVIILLVQGHLETAFEGEKLSGLLQTNVLLIIINNTAIGIITSFFLKYLNSILKAFASAIELMFTAIFCYFLFKIPVYINTFLAIGFVSIALYLYSTSPVINKDKEPKEAKIDQSV